MLEELLIKNYALIDTLQVSFNTGLNVLTGETGAGKSIIVGALGFLLGGKTDVSSIRSGCEEMEVSAIVSLSSDSKDAIEWLSVHGLQSEDGQIVLRRTLKQNGRSTAYIQGTPVSKTDLSEFTSCLFDLHGQHDQQALLRIDTHRRYLDRFAGLESEVMGFTSIFLALSDIRKKIEESRAAEKDRSNRLDLLRFAVDEISSSKIRIGEIEELEQEEHRLASWEKLAKTIDTACSLLSDDELSSINTLRKSSAALDASSRLDSTIKPLSERLSNCFYEIEDCSEQLKAYRDSLVYDPARMEELEDRLSALYKLKKKYGESEQEILDFQSNSLQEIDQLEHFEENQGKLINQASLLEQELLASSHKISQARKKAAEDLQKRVSSILATLGMVKAAFVVEVRPKISESGKKSFNQWGADEVEFFISANLGEPLRELGKTASGGELSRIMLAIKTVLANTDMVGTLIFDEIDTGIGGEVAVAVGQHLASLGTCKQIFCITHLASIAVRADNHLLVRKYTQEGRTGTGLTCLSEQERRQEIARMLAGDSGDVAALTHADELLAKYNKRSE
jgi:DNA repair protein RecN (Recombination protein N)